MLGACAGALSLTGVGEVLEQRFGLWALFQLRGAMPPPAEVVIIAMPRNTGDRISLPRERSEDNPCADLRVDEVPSTHRTLGNVPQRWGRCHHAELVRRLAPAKPRLIAFDVSFEPRIDLPRTEDRALGGAIRDAGNVVLVQQIKFEPGVGGVPEEVGPIELSRDIAEAALGIAPMPLVQLPFNRFDEFWTFKDAGWETPSLPAIALQTYAIDVYPALLSGLQRIAPEAAITLPRTVEELTRNGQLELHVLHLRSIFLALPPKQRNTDALLTSFGSGLAPEQQRNLRALLSLYTRENSRLLNFYGQGGTIRTIHIADVLKIRDEVAATDPLRLHGKAVFVGYADNAGWTLFDKFPTIYGSALSQTSGVELTATAFANLLDQSDPVLAPRWAKFSIAFAAGSCTALLCYSISTLTGSAVILLVAVWCLGAAVLIFSRTTIWLPVFIPLAAAVPLSYGYAVGYKLLHYKRDRASLRKILDQFVPPDVVEVLQRNATQLGRVHETINVACVMTDVEGFTTLSTTLSSEQVAALLAKYFDAIFRPIADYGGFVSDLKGDSILAIWPDRASEAAVRERVCTACLQMRAAVDRFNDAHPSSLMPTRIGVNYGLVTLGPVGGPGHYEYRAVGDTVNTASRIEQLSKDLGTYLLVAASVMEGLKQFLVRDLGEFSLRGRKTATRIVELVGQIDKVPAEHIELCKRFAEAKRAFDESDFERARAQFQSVLHDFPKDGPSEHFLRLIERHT